MHIAETEAVKNHIMISSDLKLKLWDQIVTAYDQVPIHHKFTTFDQVPTDKRSAGMNIFT